MTANPTVGCPAMFKLPLHGSILNERLGKEEACSVLTSRAGAAIAEMISCESRDTSKCHDVFTFTKSWITWNAIPNR